MEGRTTTTLDREIEWGSRNKGSMVKKKGGGGSDLWSVPHTLLWVPPLFWVPLSLLSSLSLLSFLSSQTLWCNPKASAGAAAQRTSLPSFPLPFSKSLSLFSLHFQRHARRGEARERRALRHNWGLFLPWKKGAIASHLLLSPLYCTILQAGGCVGAHAQCLGVLKRLHKGTTAHKYCSQTAHLTTDKKWWL